MCATRKSDAILFRGNWWLPATPDVVSTGALHATDDGLELRLDHGLFSAGIGDLREHPAVHGEVRAVEADHGLSGPITLLDAFDTFVRLGSTTNAQQRIAANLGVHGGHFARADECVVSGVSCEADALDAWLPFSDAFDTLLRTLRPGNAGRSPAASPKSIPYRLREAGGSLAFAVRQHIEHERRTYTLEERVTAGWGLTPNLSALDAVDRFVRPLQWLLTLCYSAPAPIRRLTATSAIGGLHGRTLTFYATRIEGGTLSHATRAAGRYRYPAIPVGSEPASTTAIIERWYSLLEAPELRRAVQLFCGTLAHPGLYVENRLLGVTAATEALDRSQVGDFDPASKGHGDRRRRVVESAPPDLRSWADELLAFKPRYTLRERLHRLLEANSSAATGCGMDDRDAFCQQVTRARDAIAHGLEHSAAARKSRAGMLPLVFRLVVLFTSEILRLLGTDDAQRAQWIAGSSAARRCRGVD